MVVRVKSGIPGLDKLIQGGFVKGSTNLITGTTGTGKTIFGCQFLWYGLKKGERVLHISTEQHPDDIKADMKQFGWDFEKYEKSGKCVFLYFDPSESNNLSGEILNEVQNMRATRLVVDSISLIALSVANQLMIRRKLIGLVNALKRQTNCTSLLISEIEEGSKGLSRYGVEEFVVDGVIVMQFLGIGGKTSYNLQIRKMRRTNHNKESFPYLISEKGIKIIYSEF